MTKPAAVIAGVGLVVLSAGVWWMQSRPEDDPRPAAASPLAVTALQPRTSAPPDMADRLREEVIRGLGYAPGKPSAASRLREVMEFSGELRPAEAEEVMRAMLAPTPAGESAAEHSTWFHESAKHLQKLPLIQGTFAEVLATVARDGARDLTTRDYALQHLRELWGRAEEPALRRSIEATLLEMLPARGSIRPTVLLSLHQLDPSGADGVDDATLVEAVGEALSGEPEAGHHGMRTRMVAARIAGERGLESLREPLFQLASSESAHALERMASIAALRRLGHPADVERLAALSSSDPRVAGALRHATGPPPLR